MVCCGGCNCYNDKCRYRAMVWLYIIDLIFFIIRLSLISNDVSYRVSDTIPFLVPILLFDLIGSVPIIICNITYLIMRHWVLRLGQDQNAHPKLWRFATMTCIRLDCHHERPQAIILTRIIFILSFFLLRFICFVIGASCSARFKSVCTAYTVIAAFALTASVIVMVVEFIHFSRLWSYNPTKTIRTDSNQIHTTVSDALIEKTYRRHLRFIHYSILNDQTADGFRRSKCENGNNCKSSRLHHHLFYHSLDSERNIDEELADENLKKSFIAFYRTTKAEAYKIAQKGFPYGENTGPSKDYLHLDKKIFFTPSCSGSSTTSEAIICACLNLGRVEIVENDTDLDLDKRFAYGDGTCDTVYVKSRQRLFLRMPAQIERWIISIARGVAVNDNLDAHDYVGCI